MKKLFTLLLFIYVGHIALIGQCNPAGALTCEEAGLLCGLDELDGFSCSTLSTNNPSGPNPLCSGSGIPNNTQWWSFYGAYKTVTITFNIDYNNCSLGKGIEAGVLLGCNGQSIRCNADCNTEVFSFTFWAFRCQKYFLWIDGCEGDICDFDIQVNNGEGPQAENWKPNVVGPVQCEGTEVQFCTEYDNSPCDRPFNWTIKGIDVPNSNGKICITTDIPINSPPFEVCAVFQVSDGIVICNQKVNCIMVTPDPFDKKDDGEMFICWEDHEGGGYRWRDSIIYSSCIDPPCKVLRNDQDGCIEYTSTIHLLDYREIKDVFEFICDKSDLPLITEDGGVWDVDACCAPITWSDVDYYLCDTTYYLYLEIFDPEVTISRSCKGCEDSVLLKAQIEYFPECSTEETEWTVLWLNESKDTVGVGDSIIVTEEGKYELHIIVVHTTNEFGGRQTCTVHDTAWHINIQHEMLSITGDSLICQKDTSTFSLPDSYAHGCEILWTIEDINGQIITDEPEKNIEIKVFWPDNNTMDGKICAEIVDDCDSVKRVCKTLEGCIVTLNTDAKNNIWKIYPNPVRDVIYIESDLKDLNIQMHDIHGNEILVQPKQDISGAISIDVKNLDYGIYFIVLGNSIERQVKKLVKL